MIKKFNVAMRFVNHTVEYYGSYLDHTQYGEGRHYLKYLKKITN